MLNEEEQADLKRIRVLAEDNNTILRKIHRSMQWGRFFKLLYLFIILGSMFGAYYFLQPYLEQVSGFYGGVSEGVDTLKSFKEKVSLPFGEKGTSTEPSS